MSVNDKGLESWASFLARHHSKMLNELRRLDILIRVIQKVVPSQQSRILEVGCGSSIISFFLADYGYRVVCVDTDSAVLNWVEQRFPFFKHYITLGCADVLELPFADHSFDLVFSQGLLEHFDDPTIVKALQEQRRVARIVVFDVPSRRHGPDRLRGDERLLSISHYSQLCKETGLTIQRLYGRRWIHPLECLPEDLLYNQPLLFRFFAQSSIFVCGGQ
jgi:SAM-dependent methyltransferase